MKYINKWLLIIVGFSALFLVACSGDKEESSASNNQVNEEKIVLDLNTSGVENTHVAYGIEAFTEELEKLTDGKMTVKPHYANSLGGERESIEMMDIGSLHMAAVTSGPLGNWVKEFNVFDLPFLIENYDHAAAVLNGEIGSELAEKVEEQLNVKILGYFFNGFRQMSNSKRPVETPEDVKGMKHRVQENEVQVDTWKAFGAEPTPVSYPELYSSLQQGVIDGQSNPLATIHLTNLYEVQDYVTLLNDIFSPYPLMISKSYFESLTSEQQEAIQQAADVAVKIAQQSFIEQEEEAYDALIELGVTIVDEPDRDAFLDKAQPVYDKWGPEIGEELINKIKNTEY